MGAAQAHSARPTTAPARAGCAALALAATCAARRTSSASGSGGSCAAARRSAWRSSAGWARTSARSLPWRPRGVAPRTRRHADARSAGSAESSVGPGVSSDPKKRKATISWPKVDGAKAARPTLGSRSRSAAGAEVQVSRVAAGRTRGAQPRRRRTLRRREGAQGTRAATGAAPPLGGAASHPPGGAAAMRRLRARRGRLTRRSAAFPPRSGASARGDASSLGAPRSTQLACTAVRRSFAPRLSAWLRVAGSAAPPQELRARSPGSEAPAA